MLAYLLIGLVSLKLGWLPVQGCKRIADGVGPWLCHLTLPAITLSVICIALIARVTRVTRASVLETLGEDYIRTARATGLPERQVLLGHALANAAAPSITVISIGIALLIGGVVVVTESVYAIRGLGRLTVDAVLARHFATIQGVILLLSVVYVMVNLLSQGQVVAYGPAQQVFGNRLHPSLVCRRAGAGFCVLGGVRGGDWGGVGRLTAQRHTGLARAAVPNPWRTAHENRLDRAVRRLAVPAGRLRHPLCHGD